MGDSSKQKGNPTTSSPGDGDTFQFTVDVKGFKKENIHIHKDGPTVVIECDQFMKHDTTTEVPTGKPGEKEQKVTHETGEKTLLKTTTLPIGTDMNSVQTNLDMDKGVVVITGRYSLKPVKVLQAQPPVRSPPQILTFDKDMFKLTVNIKGFRKENIKIRREGRRVFVDCRQTNVVKPNPETVPEVKKPGTAQEFVAMKESTRVFHFSTTLPEGTDLNSVKTDLDMNIGLVIFTGRASPPPPS